MASAGLGAAEARRRRMLVGHDEEGLTLTTIRQYSRAAGLFSMNLVFAVLGTDVVESTFEQYAHVASSRESLFIMDALTAAFAFGLGFSVYLRWQPTSSKWIWLAGVIWLLQRALFPPDGNHIL